MTRAGAFLLEVEAIVVDDGVASAVYLNLHTGRRGECTLAEFSGRVGRQAEFAEPSDHLISRIR